jgi:hypothetical protein
MPRPSHPSWLAHSNYTWRRVQVRKVLDLKYKRPMGWPTIRWFSQVLEYMN